MNEFKKSLRVNNRIQLPEDSSGKIHSHSKKIEDTMTSDYKKIVEEADKRIMQHQREQAEAAIRSKNFIALNNNKEQDIEK